MSWWEQASSQDGVITRRQLRDAGLSAKTVDGMLARAELSPVSAGVALVRGAPLNYRARLWAATLGTGGLLGFATAARLWGTIDGDDEPVHVVVPHARRVYPPRWVRVHRVPVAPYARTALSGLAVTSRSWSLMDHLPTLRGGARSSLADRAVQRGWLTRADIGRRLFEYPGRAGNVALRVLTQQLGDGAAAQSERKLHRLLREAGIVGWTPNYPLWRDGYLVGVLDVALVVQRIAIEVDGWAYHSDVDRFRRDRAKQNDLIALGWRVLRFTWADLTERPGYVRAMVRQLAA